MPYYRRRRGYRLGKKSFKKRVLAITRQEAEKKIFNIDGDVNFTSTGVAVQEKAWNFVLFNPSSTVVPAQGLGADGYIGGSIDVHMIQHQIFFLWNNDYVVGGTNCQAPAFARIILYSPRQKTLYPVDGENIVPTAFPDKVFKPFGAEAFQRYSIHRDIIQTFPGITNQFYGAAGTIIPQNVDSNQNKIMKYKTKKRDGWKVHISANGFDGLPDSINGVGMVVILQAQNGQLLPARNWLRVRYSRSIHYTDG